MRRTILLLAAMMLFVACGAENPPASLVPGKSTSNPTRATALPEKPGDTSVVSQDGGDALPTVAVSVGDVRQENVDCGDLSVSGKPLRVSDVTGAQAAAACFQSALNNCQPAVLTIRETDTGMVRQFNISGRRGSCLIRQALQPDVNSAPAVVDCERGDMQDGKLEIKGCSHLGDFILTLGN